jgi:hypothetical protein
MNRLFQEFELPFVPTLVVGFVLLVMACGYLVTFQTSPRELHESLESTGCRFNSSRDALIVPGTEIPPDGLYAAKRMTLVGGPASFLIVTESGTVIGSYP